ETGLVDLQRSDSRLERRSWDSEPLSRSRRSEHPAPARAECLFDGRPLVGGARPGQSEGAPNGGSRGKPARVDCEILGVAYDHRPLDHVLELANVPRPRIGPKMLKRSSVEATDGLSRFPRIAVDEVFDQDGDVIGALAKRRHRDGEHVQAIEKI